MTKGNPVPKSILRKYLNEILLEEFNEQGSLIHKLKGEIIELEYKGDPEVIQEILDQLEADKQALIIRVDGLEAANSAKDITIQSLQEDLATKDLKIQELEDRIIVLEPEI